MSTYSDCHKTDFFTCIHRFAGYAARVDWLNHAHGAHALMGGSDSPLQPQNAMVDRVRKPDNLSIGMELFDEDDGSMYLACPEDDPSDLYKFSSTDVNAFALALLNFGKWVAKLLSLPARTEPVVAVSQNLITLSTGSGCVYLSLCSGMREFQEQIEQLPNDKAGILLTMSNLWKNYAPLDKLIASKPTVQVFPIQEFISFNGRQYAYSFHTPMLKLLEHENPHAPHALFLPRPENCDWENLNLKIFTNDHLDGCLVENDYIDAWYTDALGCRLGPPKRLYVKDNAKLYCHKKGTAIYALLKGYASCKGREHDLYEKNANNRNVTRKKLREFLCSLFGYPMHDAPFIGNGKKPPLFRSRFIIFFSDANSDPLSPGRAAARTSLDE